MHSSVRRAGAFAVVATLAVIAPVAGALTAVPFALLAVAGHTVSGGRVFDLFARPGDHLDRELRGLVGFSLAVTGLALLTSLTDLPVGVFVATVLLVGYGNLAERAICSTDDTPIRRTLAFTLGATPAAFVGFLIVGAVESASTDLSTIGFLALTGALVGALIRSVRVERDDPLVLTTDALVLWAFAGLDLQVDPLGLATAVGIAGAFGYVSWLLRTASVPGMLTGVIISLATIVLGGYGWFAALIAFFGVGGLASKFRYTEKESLGVAEANDGARGTRNVLGNAAVALAAVVGFAAADGLQIDSAAFLFAFVGSIATAMSDTLSSEIGVLFGRPRLITSMRRVEPGTDGGVTLAGEIAGTLGAMAIAAIAVIAFDLSAMGGVVVVLAGVVGMNIDSLLGATVEGRWVGNQGVNFLATLVGAMLAGFCAVILGLGP